MHIKAFQVQTRSNLWERATQGPGLDQRHHLIRIVGTTGIVTNRKAQQALPSQKRDTDLSDRGNQKSLDPQ